MHTKAQFLVCLLYHACGACALPGFVQRSSKCPGNSLDIWESRSIEFCNLQMAVRIHVLNIHVQFQDHFAMK